MGWACRTYWKYDKWVQTVRRKDLNAKTHFENLNVAGGIILKWTVKLGVEGSELSQLAQDPGSVAGCHEPTLTIRFVLHLITMVFCNDCQSLSSLLFNFLYPPCQVQIFTESLNFSSVNVRDAVSHPHKRHFATVTTTPRADQIRLFSEVSNSGSWAHPAYCSKGTARFPRG